MPGWRVAVVDGDTDPADRQWARDHAQHVLTNPDLLHASLLPNHARWASFLRTLRYVVVDESHRYRGVFGAQVAAVLRRLRRVTRAVRRRTDLRGVERHRSRTGLRRRRADRNPRGRPAAGRARPLATRPGPDQPDPRPGDHARVCCGHGAGRPCRPGRAGADLRALATARRRGGAIGSCPGRLDRGTDRGLPRGLPRLPTDEPSSVGCPPVRSEASPPPTLSSWGWTSPASTPW